MDSERRADKRFHLSRMMAYDLGRDEYIRARGIDISRGGIAFLSEEYVDHDLPVWLSFCIPEEGGGWRTIESEGVVANVADAPEGCRFGVRFTRMALEDRAALDGFVRRLEAEYAEHA